MGKEHPGLYFNYTVASPIALFVQNNDVYDIWHWHLGHLSFAHLLNLAKLVDEISFTCNHWIFAPLLNILDFLFLIIIQEAKHHFI